MGYINPLMKLPAAQEILALPDSPEKRLFERLLREMRADALVTAEKSWRKRKGPMAGYWLATASMTAPTLPTQRSAIGGHGRKRSSSRPIRKAARARKTNQPRNSPNSGAMTGSC